MTSQSENCSICNLALVDEKIFTCIKCNNRCHQSCFLYKEEEIKSHNINKCDQCRHLESFGDDEEKIKKNSNQLKCAICCKKDGMLKQFCENKKSKKWTHIKCIQWFMKKMTLEMKDGFLVFCSNRPLPGEIFTGDCVECKKVKKDDIKVLCQVDGCGKTFHSECIKQHLKKEIDSDERLKSITFYCEEHFNSKKSNSGSSKLHTSVLKNSSEQARIQIVKVPEIENIQKEKSEDVILNNFSKINNNQCQSDEKNIPKIKNKKINKINDDLMYAKSKITIQQNYHNKIPMTSHNSYENSNINNFMPNDPMNEECDTFINSRIKCDICLKDFDMIDKDHLKQCDSCLTYYHTSCAKDIGDRDLKKKICRKCREDPEMKLACIVCERTQGSMIKCDAKWVHHMCASILKKFFSKKSDSQYGLTMDNKLNKIERICNLCKKKNAFTTKCERCELIYHPYCALINDLDISFIIKSQTTIHNKFELFFPCDEKHKFFILKNEKPHKEKLDKIESNSRNSFLLREKEKDLHKAHKNQTSLHNHISENKLNCGSNGHHLNLKTNKSLGTLTNNKLSSVTRSIRDRFKRLKTEKKIYIDSINYQKIRSNFINKYKGELTPSCKPDAWNWDYYNNYFLPVQENDLILLENTNSNENICKIEEIEEIIKNLSPVDESRKSTNTSYSHSISPFKNLVVCNIRKKIQNKMKEYLAVYDISKVDDMKLHPDFLNYRNELNCVSSPGHFKFLSKRRRSHDEENTTSSLELINKKNFKIIQDEEENNSKEKDNSQIKSEHSSSNKIKFSIDDVADQIGDSVSIQPFSSSFKTTLSNDLIEGETNLENVNSDKVAHNLISDSSKTNKFVKKIKLLSYFKIKKRHKESLKQEEIVIKEIRKTLKSKNIIFCELNDVDQEILIKNEMLKKTIIKNKKKLSNILEKIKNKFKEDNSQNQFLHEKNNVNNILTTYKSVSKYGNIIRRLIKGVEEKTNEEIMKNRGQTLKYYEHMLSEYKTEKEIQEKLIQNDLDCCVCFFTNTEDTNPIVFCDSCNVAVHQECYGISKIPEGDYFCDLCTFKNKNNKVIFNKECILCKNSKGAMKKLDKFGENWVHVTCVFISQFLSFKNYSTLDQILDVNNFSKNSKEKCEICKKEGGELFTFFCENKKISKAYYHFMCAYLDGYELKIKSEIKKDDKFYKKLTPLVNISELQDIELGITKTVEKKENQKRFRQASYHREDIGYNIKSLKNKLPGNMSTHKNYAKSSNLMSTGFNFQCISEDKNKHSEKSLLDNYKFSIELMNTRMDIETLNLYKDKCSVCFEDKISNITDFNSCNKCALICHNKCCNIGNDRQCDVCYYYSNEEQNKNISHFPTPFCVLCFNKGGLMKKLKSERLSQLGFNNAWAHQTCSKFTQEIILSDKNELVGFDKIPAEKLHLFKCGICEINSGIIYKCGTSKCEQKFHIYCAYLQGFLKHPCSDNTCIFYCKLHSHNYKDTNTKEILFTEPTSKILSEISTKRAYDEVPSGLAVDDRLTISECDDMVDYNIILSSEAESRSIAIQAFPNKTAIS